MGQLLGKRGSNILIVGKNMAVDWYMDEKEVKQLSQVILKKINKDPDFSRKHLLEFQERFEALIVTSKKIARIDFKNQNNSSLAKTFQRLTKTYQFLTPFMTTPIFFS